MMALQGAMPGYSSSKIASIVEGSTKILRDENTLIIELWKS